MLVEKTIEHLMSKVIGLKLFEMVYGLTELLKVGESGQRPHFYVGNGESKPIQISAFNGVVYFRKNGNITNTDASGESFVGCENLLRVIIPIKLIAIKNRTKLPTDCAYTDDWLAEKIVVEITNKNGALKISTGAAKCEVNAPTWNTNSREIWS